MENGIFGPCLCGATDCPFCYPGQRAKPFVRFPDDDFWEEAERRVEDSIKEAIDNQP
jgi:hypothetical protein